MRKVADCAWRCGCRYGKCFSRTNAGQERNLLGWVLPTLVICAVEVHPILPFHDRLSEGTLLSPATRFMLVWCEMDRERPGPTLALLLVALIVLRQGAWPQVFSGEFIIEDFALVLILTFVLVPSRFKRPVWSAISC